MFSISERCWFELHRYAPPRSLLQAEQGWLKGSKRRLSSPSWSGQSSEGNLDFSYSFLAILAACACYCLDKPFPSERRTTGG